MGGNIANSILLVFFVSVTILILSTDNAFAAIPIADAGLDQTVDEGDPITLSAAGSTDPDAAITAWKWTYTSGAPPPSPFMGNPMTNESNDEEFTYTPNLGKPGNAVLEFSLVVTSGGEDSVADTVTILVMGNSHKHDFTPGANGKFKENLGQIITGKAFGIKIANPGSLVSGSLKNLVVATSTSISDIAVDLDFSESNSIPPGLALPDIITALFLDIGFFAAGTTNSVFTDISDLSTDAVPILQFVIEPGFDSAEKFLDGCPVVSFQLLDEVTLIWGEVDDGPTIDNAHKIYVSNSDGDSVSVIDGSTNDVIGTDIAVGDTPKSLIFDQSTNRVYVVNVVDGTVSVIDTTEGTVDENTVIATITVGNTPSSIAINESTDRIYVTNSGDDTVSVIDGTVGSVNENTVVFTIIAGDGIGDTPSSVAVYESTNRIYVVNSGDDNVSVFNIASDVNSQVGSDITVGSSPSSVTVNESGGGVYVTNSGGATVSVINGTLGSPTQHTVVATIAVGTTPTGLGFNTATEKLYVANSGSGSVTIIDTPSYIILGTTSTGAGATDVAINPNTSRIFVANSGAGTVSVIDGILGTATVDTEIDEITGFSSNFGVALNPTIPNPVRDPSADEKTGPTIDQCAYIATPPHFSKFAIGGIKALALGGIGAGSAGGAPITSLSTLIINQNFDAPDEIVKIVENSDSTTVLAPIPTSRFADFDLPLTINDNGYPLGGFSNTIETFSTDIGEPLTITSLYYEQTVLQHVSMYMNLRGVISGDLSKSDTQIIYNKDKPLTVIDPNGFFESVSVNVIEGSDTIKKFATFEIVFAKHMDTSDIVLRSWDDRLRSMDTIIYDAIQVIEQESNPVDTPNEFGTLSFPELEGSKSILDPDSLDKARDELIESTVIPAWIKTSTGWWADGSIGDNDFVLGIEHMIKNDIIIIPNIPEHDAETPREKIPDWIKTNAGWWANGQVSDEEFTQSLQWLITNGVIGI